MGLEFLLDTNTLSLAIRGRAPRAAARLLSVPRDRVAMSIITAMEFRFGLAKKPDTPHRPAALALLAAVPIAGLPDAIAETYGTLRAALERRGRGIGALDTIIAAHALAVGCTLVTNNLREFGRIPGLRCEDWTASA